jgi:hypothetical protein
LFVFFLDRYLPLLIKSLSMAVERFPLLNATLTSDGGADGCVAAARGVAVAGWQWYRWIEEVAAVRMVPKWAWQWQYWPRCADGQSLLILM